MKEETEKQEQKRVQERLVQSAKGAYVWKKFAKVLLALIAMVAFS